MFLTNDSNCTHEHQSAELAKIISSMSFPFKELNNDDYIKFLAYIIIIIGGLIGNISVILTVVLNRSMRTTINYYVANLATADALICIFCMGTHAIQTLTQYFALGAFMCKFSTFMQMMCLLSSVLTLSAISCDRFISIMFPLHARITKQRTSIVMLIIWVISIIISLPFLFFKQLKIHEFKNFVQTVCEEWWPKIYYYDDLGKCQSIEQYRITYYITCSITLYFIPIIVMMTAYSLMLWKLWISEVPGERHAANVKVQDRARKKVIKMVLVVLIAFIICWTPMQIQIFISAFPSETQSGSWLKHYQWVSNYLAFANSCINPIIYGVFRKTFRDGFCLMLRCGYRRDRFFRKHGTNDDSGSEKKSTMFTTLRSVYSSITSINLRTKRSKLTFTTGVTSIPSRFTSKTINGTKTNSSQKSDNMEKLPVCHSSGNGETSPNMKDICVNSTGGEQFLEIFV